MRGAGTKRAAIYRQAIAASPESAFLYRDLAAVEQQAGQSADALEHYRKAVELDAQRCAIARGNRRDSREPGRRARRAGRRTSGRGRSIRPRCPTAPSPRLRAAPRSRSCRRSIAPFRGECVGDARRDRVAGRRPARAAAGAGAAAAGRSSPTSAGTGRSRGSRRSCARRDGHAAELRVRAVAAGAARRARDHGVAAADADRVDEAGAGEEVAGRARHDQRRAADAPELSGGVGRGGRRA